MGKYWSFFFGAVLLALLGLFVVAPFVGWWLPKNVSIFGDKVDGLFYLILAITGFFFILTEALLVYFMYEYAHRPEEPEHPVGHHYAEKKVFWTSFFKHVARPVSAILHDQHRVEMAWTLVPGLILLYIAFAQINAWQEIKDPTNMPKDPDVAMEVSARMYEWRVRYPVTGTVTADKINNWVAKPQSDDVHVVNEIHCWKDTKDKTCRVKVFLKSKDVIHSFYLPNLRLKQDALPGKTIPVWFAATDYNTAYNPKTGRWEDGYDPETDKFLDPAKDHTQTWELACAELCGWGHYKMRGKLYVHKDRADFLKWLAHARDEQMRTKPRESKAPTK